MVAEGGEGPTVPPRERGWARLLVRHRTVTRDPAGARAIDLGAGDESVAGALADLCTAPDAADGHQPAGERDQQSLT